MYMAFKFLSQTQQSHVQTNTYLYPITRVHLSCYIQYDIHTCTCVMDNHNNVLWSESAVVISKSRSTQWVASQHRNSISTHVMQR